jgi:hypothetical protein
MGRVCNTYGGEEEYIQRYWCVNLKETGHLENPKNKNSNMTLRWSLRKYDEWVDRTNLAHGGDK